MGDYSEEERDCLRQSQRVFFPTPRFVDVFQALDIPTFPSPTTYRYQSSRFLQNLLLQCLDLPHVRSRIYFGARQKQRIPWDFDYPFLAMGPRIRPGTVHEVHGERALRLIAPAYTPLVIREMRTWDRRIRLVCVNYECIGALESIAKAHFESVRLEEPTVAPLLGPTLDLVRRARLDDIMIEWGYGQGKWVIIELSRPPFRFLTPNGIINRHNHICSLIQTGAL